MSWLETFKKIYIDLLEIIFIVVKKCTNGNKNKKILLANHQLQIMKMEAWFYCRHNREGQKSIERVQVRCPVVGKAT